jgi:hypothetical protein
MNTRLKTSLLTLTLLAAACSTEVSDEDFDMNDDALEKNKAIAGSVGSLGTWTSLSARKVPRVLSRSASGTNVTIKLDRALDADELPLSKVQVLVVRPSGSGFVKRNLATGASLSADKTTLSISLSEPVRAGEIYFARGEWRPCPGSSSGMHCGPRPAQLGEIIVKSGRTNPIHDVINLDVGVFRPKLAAAPILTVAPPQTELVLAEEPPASQGTFRVKSMTPAGDSTQVDRRTDKVIITFDGGTIDCARTGRGKSAFHMHSVSPDVYDQQSMYEDPAASTPNAGGYRGHLRCEEDTNRIVFTTPGVLLGDAWFQIDLNAWSKEGNFMGNKVLEFKTKRPGLQVLATRVENHYGGDNTCDDDLFGQNHCDIYVTTAIATAGGGQPSRIPEQGDFGGMTYFPSDPNGGKRDLWPPRVLYANANPIDEVVDVQMWAVDADDNSTWKKVFETAGKVAGAMAAALTPIRPDLGAISEGASAGFIGLAEVIPTNEDDFLGSGRFIFTASNQRWGTQATYPIVLDLSKNAPNRGPVKVFIHTEELPPSWRLPGPIL